MTLGAAQAQDLDLKSMILMPGPLISAHAEEEKNCEACHSSFDKKAQDRLCLECHEPIAVDREGGEGFHGRAPQASRRSCRSCHTDHKGRAFNSVPLDQDHFVHDDTDFPLHNSHAGLPCTSCHEPESLYREAPGQCLDCHGEQEPHGGALGEACASCHRDTVWDDLKVFDHSTTEFPLSGKHQSLACASCHSGEKYRFDSTECASCHRVDDVHLGRYGQQCSRCHTESGWQESGFDHVAETDFALLGMHSKQPCSACHLKGPLEESPGAECVDCHSADDIHSGGNGTACSTCHGNESWQLEFFDHTTVSEWPLQGAHTGLSCLQCHRGAAEKERGADCFQCHRADDPHRSESLRDCAACHDSSRWNTSSGFDHEITRFPLEGMHAIATCRSCHENHQFQLTPGACVDCHGEDDVHESGLGDGCGSCHGPNGWQLTRFDHGQVTGYELEGPHVELTCSSCHTGTEANELQGSCGSCHRADDRHAGNFGSDCGRCHGGKTFREISWSN